MNLNTIAEELFSKVRGRFPSVTIGDGDGNVTNEPQEARYFEFSFNKESEDKISISLDEETGVVIMYADTVAEDSIAKGKWYDFLRQMRMFSKKRMLNFDVRNITKSNLEKRDYKYLATNSGESSMNESKLYGTSKLSYQDMDGARMVIKHTESVNDDVPTGRTRNIGAIYIESPEGERFKYPFRHLAGARAMARHVAEGGTTYDEFGHHIVDLSEELSKLRKFKNYMGRSKVMAESLADYMGIVNERISTVKKRIDSLQKPNFYKEAYETFEKPVFEEIPEDVKENWIDQLTIRQFNEELKDVFPYIYKLIGEGTRAQELGPEDFMSEEDCDDDDDVEEGIGRKFNKAMSWGNTTPDEMKKRVRKMSDDELKKLAKGAGDKEGGSGSERGLQIKLINQELKRRFGIKPGKDVSEDEDPCWDNYKQVGMKKKGGKEVPNCVPKEEMEIESYFNKLMGEWADQDAVDEASIDHLSGELETDLEKNKRKLKDLKQMKAELWGDSDKQTMLAIQKKENELVNNIKQLMSKIKSKKESEAGEPGEQQTPLSEFILSFYDRTNGSFPKGETAVLTMVEKDYGDEFIEPAKTFIERINHTFEQYSGRQKPSSNLAEEGSEGTHAFFSEEKGPNNWPGVAIRVLNPHPTALHGFTRSVYDFWASMEQYEAGEKGMNGNTKADVEAAGIVLHNSPEEAIQAAKADENGNNESDEEFDRVRRLAGL